MKIKTAISALILTLVCGLHIHASDYTGNLRLFPTVSSFFKKVIDTPDRTYFIVMQQACIERAKSFNEEQSYLFVFDKESEELLPYTMLNKLNDNIVADASYNRAKGYLLIVYTNGNIDLLYDDDTVYNIPGFKSAVIRTDKTINAISFDAENNHAYLTGKFGYFVIDDKKKEISESREYGVELFGIARAGKRLIVSTADELLESPTDNKHYSLSDFTPVAGTEKAIAILPVANPDIVAYTTPKTHMLTFNDDGTATKETIIEGSITNISECKEGYLLNEDSNAILLRTDSKSLVYIPLPEENKHKPFGTWNFKEFWTTNEMKGIGCKTYDNEKKTWTVTRADFVPNQPVLSRPWNIGYSPKYGMLFCNEIFNSTFGSFSMGYKALINGFKDEVWTNYSPAFHTPDKMYATIDPRGITIDPANEDIAWTGTFMHGFASINLADPEDSKFYSYAEDSQINKLKGFHAVFPSGWSCQVSKPEFDSEGTMWMAFNTEHTGGGNEIWFWRAEDRKKDDISKIGSFKIPNFNTKYNFVTPLKHPKNKNLIVASNNWSEIAVINHGGNPGQQPSSSNVNTFSSANDQDGNPVKLGYVQGFYEDPETGNVWVLNTEGVFDFAPSEALSTGFRVHRCKIARNDGTNLADYLLDGIPVSRMATDPSGRKWFATQGAGVVLTSKEGTEVIRQLTEENSFLPSDIVYGVGCNPVSDKVWFGTEHGICEYTSDVTPAEDNYDNIKIFPNPVRPDFYDPVTIEGLMDNSLVKIVDAQGGLVRELGRSQGGAIKWDVTGLNGERVKSGIYYIMISQSSEGVSGNKTAVITVIN